MGSFTGTAIDRLRLEAKRLLKDILRGDAAALQRFTQYWPASGPSGEVRNLARTQLVIARERGYRSWAHLKTSLLSQKETVMETQISSPITLDAETARVMAENDDGSIHLERIEALNVETARALAGAKMWSGKLPRLTSLSVETARALAQFKGKKPLARRPHLDRCRHCPGAWRVRWARTASRLAEAYGRPRCGHGGLQMRSTVF
jgi:hypothetical protein